MTAWVLSACPYVWSVTLTPVSPVPARNRVQLYDLATALRAYGDVGYMFAVEQEGQTHAHAIMWSDFDIDEVVNRSPHLVFNRVADTYDDRFRVARYLTKTVHKHNDLAKHLELNGRLVGKSKNFWCGFLDYRHVKREYWLQKGWLESSQLKKVSPSLAK